MSRLVLAIETDPDQSTRLEQLLGQLQPTEFVLARSASDAFVALGTRVPDLIVTTPLLPWKDERMIVDRLDLLAEPAAHVQRLVTPVLAGPKSRSSLLSSLRGDRTGEPLTAGCQSDVFREQVIAYLERAVANREERALRYQPSATPSTSLSAQNAPTSTDTADSGPQLWPASPVYAS